MTYLGDMFDVLNYVPSMLRVCVFIDMKLVHLAFRLVRNEFIKLYASYTCRLFLQITIHLT